MVCGSGFAGLTQHRLLFSKLSVVHLYCLTCFFFGTLCDITRLFVVLVHFVVSFPG